MLVSFPRFRHVSHRVFIRCAKDCEETRAEERVCNIVIHVDRGARKEITGLLRKNRQHVPSMIALPKGIVLRSDAGDARVFVFQFGDQGCVVYPRLFGLTAQEVRKSYEKGFFPLRWEIVIDEDRVSARMHRADADRSNPEVDRWFKVLRDRHVLPPERVSLGTLSEPLQPYIDEMMAKAWRSMISYTTRDSDAESCLIGFRSSVEAARKAFRDTLHSS